METARAEDLKLAAGRSLTAAAMRPDLSDLHAISRKFSPVLLDPKDERDRKLFERLISREAGPGILGVTWRSALDGGVDCLVDVLTKPRGDEIGDAARVLFETDPAGGLKSISQRPVSGATVMSHAAQRLLEEDGVSGATDLSTTQALRETLRRALSLAELAAHDSRLEHPRGLRFPPLPFGPGAFKTQVQTALVGDAQLGASVASDFQNETAMPARQRNLRAFETALDMITDRGDCVAFNHALRILDRAGNALERQPESNGAVHTRPPGGAPDLGG